MKKMSYFQALRFLYRFIRPYRANFILFYSGWLLETVLSVSMPILFGVMIDQVVYYHDTERFMRIGLIYLVLVLFSCILYFMIYAQHHYIMNRFTYDIRHELFRHIHECRAEVLSGEASGEALTIIQNYPQECMFFLIRDVIHTVNNILTVVFVSAELVILDLRMGLLVFAAVPVAVFLSARFGKTVREYSSDERKMYGGYVGWLFEMLENVRNLGAIGAVRRADKRLVVFQRDLFDIKNRKNIASLTSDRAVVLTNLVLQMMIFVLAGRMAAAGALSFGGLTVILAFYDILKDRIRTLSFEYLNTQGRLAYFQKISDLLESPTEKEWPGEEKLAVTEGSVTFENVSFSYTDGNGVLNDFSLTVRPSERVAVVGESGCGKSTIIDILSGFYAPDHGSIRIDGQGISGCTLHSLRDAVGVVRQNVLVFDGTVAENLRLGKKDATESEMKEVLGKAGLWDTVAEFPKGLETVLGSSGRSLSGGERQRLAIARIYLKDPKIMVFDEATSSLDEETEREILKAWDRLLSGRTTIIISHRQSAVMLCDRAVILKDGSASESGRPYELERCSETFRRLFALEDEA